MLEFVNNTIHVAYIQNSLTKTTIHNQGQKYKLIEKYEEEEEE